MVVAKAVPVAIISVKTKIKRFIYLCLQYPKVYKAKYRLSTKTFHSCLTGLKHIQITSDKTAPEIACIFSERFTN